MPYKNEQRQVLRTIKQAGNNERIIISSSGKKSAFGGKKLERDLKMEVYFCQGTVDNNSLDKAPNLTTSTKLIVAAIDDDGEVIKDFIRIIKDKSATVEYANGEVFSIDNARVTIPDNKNPILARVLIGG